MRCQYGWESWVLIWGKGLVRKINWTSLKESDGVGAVRLEKWIVEDNDQHGKTCACVSDLRLRSWKKDLSYCMLALKLLFFMWRLLSVSLCRRDFHHMIKATTSSLLREDSVSWQSVTKRWHLNYIRRVITQKKAYKLSCAEDMYETFFWKKWGLDSFVI
jgi:hypothetical protein